MWETEVSHNSIPKVTGALKAISRHMKGIELAWTDLSSTNPLPDFISLCDTKGIQQYNHKVIKNR